METLDSIFTRRSIRVYRPDRVPAEILTTMLKSAMSAPSAKNTQPWHFIVIDKRKLLDEIRVFHPYASMLETAPMAIAVCGDKRAEPSHEYLAVDCSAATENLLLAAHSLGLGGVWLGIYPKKERMEELTRLLELPDEILPVSLIAIGYAAESKEAEDRYNPAKIHKNKW